MSVQSELDRIISAIGAAYDAVEAKGGTVPQSETIAGLAAAVQSIQTGGMKINIPDGCVLTTGTFTPVTSGMDVINKIQIAKSLEGTPVCNVQMFCIVRSDGFDAISAGGTNPRYLIAYCGLRASEIADTYKRNGGGVVIYINGTAFACGGGVETTTSTIGYGIPGTNSSRRSNALIRFIESNGKLEFSSFGLICLEAAKEYRWFAIIDEGAEI